jgi:hypothetical protein
MGAAGRVAVSLATDEIRTLLARLDVMVVRAGIAIDHRAIGVIDEIIACVKDIEDSDKRLEWAYPREDD